MKKLHKLLLKAYAGPFVLTFCITIFILVMQFLWMYIDELVGKGLEWYIILELITYAAANLVPLALPIAILLASIMTFGNLGENNELVAIKSAGISLQKAMLPIFIVVVFTGYGAFYFANSVWPVANLKFATLLYDIRQKKPAIDIKPGMFYKGIDGYVIRIGGKSDDGIMLYDLSIYDHTKRMGATTVIKAEKGKMKMSDDERYLVLTLYNGHSYEEVKDEKNNKIKNDNNSYFPLFRNSFNEEIIRFDLQGFSLERTKDELFKDNYKMLNLSQLSSSADTIQAKINTRKKEHIKTMLDNYSIFRDSLTINNKTTTASTIFQNLDNKDKLAIIATAQNLLRSQKTYARASSHEVSSRNDYIIKYDIEWHRKFVMGAACIVLFLVGAPLGAIIRKGGLGLPVVISVLGFMVQYISMMVGEKLVKQATLTPFSGMWLAIFILAPIGIFLTYKSTTDSAIMESNTYVNFIRKGVDFTRKFIKKKQVKS